MHRSRAFARVRLELARSRPFDASLELRIQCWLTRVARAIRQRDTPHDPPPARPDSPA